MSLTKPGLLVSWGLVQGAAWVNVWSHGMDERLQTESLLSGAG